MLVAFCVAFALVSDAALSRSEAFWRLCRERLAPSPMTALGVEAELGARAPGSVAVVVLGSSVARSNVDVEALGAALGLAPDEIARVWLPRALPVETAMVLPQLERLRPPLVVALATPAALRDELIDWERLRLYDPRVTWALLGPGPLWRDRRAHASGVLGWLHVAVRHRAELRGIAAGALTGRLPEAPAPRGPDERASVPATADLSCDALSVRALELAGRRLRAHATHLLVVPAPMRPDRPWQERALQTLEGCLAARAREGRFGFLGIARLDFGVGEFEDEIHMNERGRARYGAHLAARLAQLPLRRPGSDRALR